MAVKRVMNVCHILRYLACYWLSSCWQLCYISHFAQGFCLKYLSSSLACNLKVKYVTTILFTATGQYSENNKFYNKLKTDLYGDKMKECLCHCVSFISKSATCILFFLCYILSSKGDCDYHCRDFVWNFYFLSFSVLIANKDKCPFESRLSQWWTCYSSSFPDEFIKDSIAEICQYVLFISVPF